MRCVSRAKAPRTCSQNAVPLLERDQSRINVELTNPHTLHRPFPFPPAYSFLSKIYTCSLSRGEGEGGGREGNENIWPEVFREEKEKSVEDQP